MVIDLKIYVLCGAALLAGGCATAPGGNESTVSTPVSQTGYQPDKPYRSSSSLSEADNVFLAAACTIETWPRGSRVIASDQKSTDLSFGRRAVGVSSLRTGVNAAVAALPATAAEMPLRIQSAWDALPAVLVMMGVRPEDLAPSKPKHLRPHNASRIVFWMPRDLATDTKDAWQKVESFWADALDAANSEIHAPYDGMLVRRAYGLSYFDAIGKQTVLVIRGGECDKPNVTCSYESMNMELPKISDAPDFIGAGKVWASAPALLYSSVDGAHELRHYAASDLPDLAVYRTISAHLPSWAYIYLAAGSISLGDGKGLLAEPLVLNRGQLLKFGRTKKVNS